MGELDGRVAIVTGAGAGLGRAIAGRLADAGARVVVFEIDGESARAPRRAGRRVPAGRRRRREPRSTRPFARSVRSTSWSTTRASRVGKELHEVTDHEWHRSIDVMQARRLLACGPWRRPCPAGRGLNREHRVDPLGDARDRERIAYCAPKAAVLMMTRCAAADWGDRGLRVNCISPGFQRTPMWDADIEAGVVDGDRLLAGVPAGRDQRSQRGRRSGRYSLLRSRALRRAARTS